MKRHILLLLPIFLAACATGPSAYGPVDENSRYGFQQTQIEEDRFRVSFTGKSEAEAHDYALLRAAELTLDQGFSHFRVLDGYVEDDRRRGSNVSTSIGVGFGSGGYRRYGRGSRTNVGIGIGIHDLARALEGDRVTNSIEFKMMRSGSDEPNVYEAESVASSIQPAVFK